MNERDLVSLTVSRAKNENERRETRWWIAGCEFPGCGFAGFRVCGVRVAGCGVRVAGFRPSKFPISRFPNFLISQLRQSFRKGHVYNLLLLIDTLDHRLSPATQYSI